MEAKGFKIDVDTAVKKFVAQEGYDPLYGARPIKRVIQKQILDTLADKLIKSELHGSKKIKISFKAPHTVTVG